MGSVQDGPQSPRETGGLLMLKVSLEEVHHLILKYDIPGSAKDSKGSRLASRTVQLTNLLSEGVEWNFEALTGRQEIKG